MTPEPSRFERLAWPFALVTVITAWQSASWQADVGRGDFGGHAAVLAWLSRRIEDGSLLPLWTGDWNAGASLVFGYLHPLFSDFLLLPFVEVFGLVPGLRIGDSFFVVLAGLSMYAFGRELVGSRCAAALGGGVYALHPSVSSFVLEAGQLHQPVSLAIVPMVFWAWTRLAHAPIWRHRVFAAVASALLFYDMERFWLVAPYAFALYLCIATRRGGDTNLRTAFRRIFGPAAWVGLGLVFLLAFPVWPALLERPLLQWHDPNTLEVFRRFYSFPHLLALLDRDGALADTLGPHIAPQFVALPGQWYQGLVAFAYVAIGVVFVLRDPAQRRERAALALGLAGYAIALWFAFGVHAIGPKHAALFQSVAHANFPVLAIAGTALVAVTAFFAIALRVGMTSLREQHPRAGRFALPLAIGLVVLVLFAKPFVVLADGFFVYAHLRAPSHFAFPALPFLLATSVCLATPAWLRRVGPARRVAFACVVVLFVLIDLAPYRVRPQGVHPPQQMAAWQAAFENLADAPEGRLLDTHHFNPTTDMLDATLSRRGLAWSWLGWASTREIGDVVKTGFYDSLRIARQRADVRAANAQVAAELAGLANVRFISRLAGISPPLPSSSEFDLRFESPHIEIYENRRALPFVQFHPERAALEATRPDSVPRAAALAQRGIAAFVIGEDDLPDDLPFAFTDASIATAGPSVRSVEEALDRPRREPSSLTAPCDLERPHAEEIVLRCRFDRPGTLVLAEAWFPNWRLEREDSVEVPPRVNHAFLGAAVGSGEQTLRFVYKASTATRVARGVSAIAWLAALLFLTTTLRRTPKTMGFSPTI